MTAFEDGMRVRREVMGDEYVDAAEGRRTAFNEAFQDYITTAAWGSVWTRGQLDRRTRSAITLAVLTALGHEHELKLHVAGARRNGLSDEEIAEVLLHTSVYAGVPAANRAVAAAAEVITGDG